MSNFRTGPNLSDFMGDTQDWDVSNISTAPATGMDAFFAASPQIVSPVGETKIVEPERVMIGRLSQLKGFARVSSDMLVNKSTNDLWAIKKQDNGQFFIERLFQDDGAPLKG